MEYGGWCKNLETGNELIDQQHKELFRRFDLFREACNREENPAELGKMLLFLEQYVRVHFHDEEELMRKHTYPGYEPQRQHHRKASQCIEQMRRAIEESELSRNDLLREMNQTVMEWLINHIYTMDMVLAKYLRSKAEREGS